MIKKILLTLLTFLITINTSFANWPNITCIWLPWCSSEGGEDSLEWISDIIALAIQYVAVIAVIALVISWVMFMLSSWDEEKVKKAKKWIIWSLVWVLLSISAWWIVNMLNEIQVNF